LLIGVLARLRSVAQLAHKRRGFAASEPTQSAAIERRCFIGLHSSLLKQTKVLRRPVEVTAENRRSIAEMWLLYSANIAANKNASRNTTIGATPVHAARRHNRRCPLCPTPSALYDSGVAPATMSTPPRPSTMPRSVIAISARAANAAASRFAPNCSQPVPNARSSPRTVSAPLRKGADG
jgi:hypothetical protein